MNEDLAWQLTNGLQQHGGPQWDHTNNSTTGQKALATTQNTNSQYTFGYFAKSHDCQPILSLASGPLGAQEVTGGCGSEKIGMTFERRRIKAVYLVFCFLCVNIECVWSCWQVGTSWWWTRGSTAARPPPWWAPPSPMMCMASASPSSTPSVVMKRLSWGSRLAARVALLFFGLSLETKDLTGSMDRCALRNDKKTRISPLLSY